MSASARRRVDLAVGYQQAGEAVRRRIMALGWPLAYFETDLRKPDGLRLAVAFGTTTPFGGATGLSVLTRGAAAVAFLVRVEEMGPASSRVELLAGGTEGWAGIDWGRNAGVAERFLRELDLA